MNSNKRRSDSFDGSSLSTGQEHYVMSELEAEIANTVLMRQRLNRKRDGPAHVKQITKPWIFCFRAQPQWEKKHLILTQDRLIITNHKENLNGLQFKFSELSANISKLPGHTQLMFCLNVADGKNEVEVSLTNMEEMEFWLGKLQEGVQAKNDVYFYSKE